MRHPLLALFMLLSLLTSAQEGQVVRGMVVDQETRFPLFTASLIITTMESPATAVADMDGNFVIENVPIGKHVLKVNMVGYKSREIAMDVTSGKQKVITVELEEDVAEVEEVVVTHNTNGEVQNEMASTSAHQFSVSETDRYAGSRGDPARMASNFAGVGGSDDSRNDIVVRGNSPLGVRYIVEGVEIPNPNHFAIAGSSGGPVGILNNKLLRNSDFYTGAFPAEFGNSVSSIFDLNLRSGNPDVHEMSFQFGFLGTELMSEGPLNKEKGHTYLVMGRYATLDIFQKLGITIGTDAVPTYGDGAFHFNFRLKKGTLGVWGIGGSSSIDIMPSESDGSSEEVYGESDRDQHFGSTMGVAGLTLTMPLNRTTLLKTTLSTGYERQRSRHDFLVWNTDAQGVSTVDSMYQLFTYSFNQIKPNLHVSLVKKYGKNHVLKYGVNTEYQYVDMLDSGLNVSHTQFLSRWDHKGGSILVQPFVQYKWRPNDKFSLLTGWHMMYSSLGGGHLSLLEPRIGATFTPGGGHRIDVSATMHSQMQPMYQYFYQQPDMLGRYVQHNIDMDFTKSIHTVLGYRVGLKKGFSLRAETYYQYIYNVPVTKDRSAFSMLNQGSGFQRFYPDTLENKGIGRNYGIELTMEKFFNKNYFLLVTGTLFNSEYQGSDNQWRKTDFNGMYAVNMLGGIEYTIKKKHTLQASLKFTMAGGKRYGYVDTAASNLRNELVYLDSGYNSRQFKDYMRFDMRVMYRLNAKKTSHEFGIDLVNLLGIQNLLGLSYDPTALGPEPVRENYQLGFLPIFYYKIDFKIAGGRNKG